MLQHNLEIYLGFICLAIGYWHSTLENKCGNIFVALTIYDGTTSTNYDKNCPHYDGTVESMEN